ncbi:hypothetical protein HYV49_04575 [Candidatus Pacearchaeota archaeon]|nr:hypothetical protein [Candidatus Pacearchaeota archaeon]
MAKIKKHVVKRKGLREIYDEKKVYASVYSAALNCHYSEQKAEGIADKAKKSINSWIKNKSFVSSDEIRYKIIKVLKDKHVALMYKHHLDLG